ncbi:MAG: hypothetical protein FWC95_08095 [Defluviitaleaceae bacterium]|nr:hypothetical protein [Defluviitaleaceae bacterium]
MDINCTDNCVHQHDGKCVLVTLPASARLNTRALSHKCLYYDSPHNKPSTQTDVERPILF